MTLQLIFSLFTLVLCAVFFIYVHLYIRRRTSRESILAAYRDEVNRLIAEIDHATDRDTQLVEERIAALRKILEETDRRIALMSRDMEKRRSTTELYTALSRSTGPTLQPPAQDPPPAPPTPAVPAHDAPAPSPPAAPSVPAADTPVPGGPTQRVLELSRQGFAAEIIASRLGLSLAEVELTLAVSRRRGEPGPQNRV
jgi:hypothetical protein